MSFYYNTKRVNSATRDGYAAPEGLTFKRVLPSAEALG